MSKTYELEVTQPMADALCRLNGLGDVLGGLAAYLPSPKFNERHPKEYAELKRIAADMRGFKVEEFDRLAFRIERLLAELAEMDRMSGGYRVESRQVRKQLDLLGRAFEQLGDAWEALLKGAETIGLRPHRAASR